MTWKANSNIPDETPLPQICANMYRSIAGLKADFEQRPNAHVFVRAAKYKKTKSNWENTAFALWLHDLEAMCMIEAIAHLHASGVQVASLIHDGALVRVSDRDLVDV